LAPIIKAINKSVRKPVRVNREKDAGEAEEAAEVGRDDMGPIYRPLRLRDDKKATGTLKCPSPSN
jgi:hypothetical protein